jgi:hypothetical protein
MKLVQATFSLMDRMVHLEAPLSWEDIVFYCLEDDHRPQWNWSDPSCDEGGVSDSTASYSIGAANRRTANSTC